MRILSRINFICVLGMVGAVLILILALCGESLGIRPAANVMGYETRLFDYAKVHTLDIVMDGWEDFLSVCENEEYVPCSVVIDGETWENVGLRAKGNTSLTSVRSMNSQRYSMKIEFDRYEKGETYYGLDKLCLNNSIQDNTYMKDYLTYRMMNEFEADAPLCSYVYVTVNQQKYGLFLAVEAVEDGFLRRNYGLNGGRRVSPAAQWYAAYAGNAPAERYAAHAGNAPAQRRAAYPRNVSAERRAAYAGNAPSQRYAAYAGRLSAGWRPSAARFFR